MKSHTWSFFFCLDVFPLSIVKPGGEGHTKRLPFLSPPPPPQLVSTAERAVDLRRRGIFPLFDPLVHNHVFFGRRPVFLFGLYLVSYLLLFVGDAIAVVSQLFTDMWKRDPRERPSAREVVLRLETMYAELPPESESD